MLLENKKYTTGDIGKLLGMTHDAVRHYEKLGLLPVEQERKTKFRNYKRTDVITMYLVRRMKRIGIPLADIQKLINENLMEQTDVYLKKHLMNLREQERELQCHISETEKIRTSIKKAQKYNEKIFVEMSPTFLMKNIQDGINGAEECFAKKDENSIPELISVYYGEKAARDLENRFLEESRVSKVELFVALEIEEPEMAESWGDEVWLEQMCIHTVIKTHYEEVDFSSVIMYAKQHNYILTGKILFKLLYREQKEKESWDYYEVWCGVR